MYNEREATRFINEIRKLIKKWKPILFLQDWEILIEPRQQIDMKKEGAAMQIEAAVGSKRAHLYVNMDVDYDHYRLLHSMEEVLIHELIHLLTFESGLEFVNGDEELITVMDNICDRVARVLRELKNDG